MTHPSFLLLAALLPFSALAQTPADPLTAATSQYTKSVEAFETQRKAALQPVIDRYLAALDAVAPLVARSGSSSLAAAVAEERAAVMKGAPLPAKPGPAIPEQVHKARRDYVTAADRVSAQWEPRLTPLRQAYLRQLATLETHARSQNNQPLLARLSEERQKVAGPNVAARGSDKNLLRNGDFSLPAAAAATVPNWEDTDGAGAIATENGNPFLRLQGKSVRQSTALPADTKSLRVEGRLRIPDFKELPLPGRHYAGIRILFEDARGGHLTHVHVGEITDRQRPWKQASDTVKVPAGAARLTVVLFREGIDGALDVDNLSIEPLTR
jgi:hypothetical protein